MAKRPLPSPELLRQLLRHEPETGKLFWRERPVSMFSGNTRICRAWNSRFSGKEALFKIHQSSCKQYYSGTVLGITMMAHRVIYAMVTGEYPDQVDHDNRDGLDNRFKNLKPSNGSLNHRNCKLRKDSTTGVHGVYFRKDNGRWHARISGGSGKLINLGCFAEKSDAIAARRAAEIEHGYHPNHGKP